MQRRNRNVYPCAVCFQTPQIIVTPHVAAWDEHGKKKIRNGVKQGRAARKSGGSGGKSCPLVNDNGKAVQTLGQENNTSATNLSCRICDTSDILEPARWGQQSQAPSVATVSTDILRINTQHRPGTGHKNNTHVMNTLGPSVYKRDVTMWTLVLCMMFVGVYLGNANVAFR